MDNLTKLPNSALQPKRIWIESVSLDEREGQRTGEIRVSGRLDASSQEDGGVLLRLTISNTGDENDGSPYRFAVVLGGAFDVRTDIDAKQASNLLRINAPAILYGVARGYLASITALARAGALLLPTANMFNLVADDNTEPPELAQP